MRGSGICLRITSHPVRWTTGLKDLAWYSARGERLAADVFDAWLPVTDAARAWCEVFGSRSRRLSRTGKAAASDVGGSHEAMTALTRARDDALAAIAGR
jgi:hypothetical protein